MDDDDGRPPPDSFAALTARIHEHGPHLTPAYRSLARLILEDPEGVAFLSVGDVAERAGVNMSTVSRFAKSLGLSGYPALRQLCEDHLRAQTLVQRLHAVTKAEPQLWQRSARFDEENIARTFGRIAADDIAKVARCISDARAVHVLGLRKSHSAAYLLWFLLHLVRDDVRLFTTGVLVEQVRDIRAEDTLIAFGLHRYTRYTVLACRYARQRGATTVVLTDNAASPLVPLGDHVFLVDTAGPGVLRSMTAFVSLSQAIASTVAAHLGAASRDALATEESLLDQFRVYFDQDDLDPAREPAS
ncbi:MAG TPA: MurR/RpiR family transcriptional regulator [Natronosporangium sp.]|nr:MurR/RpiR family transcriptional regulator [Natronosporangium sp.]